ncbi:peptidylprolyl isomerase [Synechococcus sp. A15-127]|uniref:peptidylprolyl isomerase n=1 Tax=Synechococcus sp. A15-127 TaxID=1050624 RepID=UPI00185F97F0|nr:peptidylprolyl isomerase [Synechococcus sp. A15-127]QNI95845.1 peptidylprolyl isomerase [Synechococcus sp. A15-127]
MEYQELQAIFDEWLTQNDHWKPIIYRSASSETHSINLQTFQGGHLVGRFLLSDNLAERINSVLGDQLPIVLTQDWIDVSLLDDQISGAPQTVANFERYVEEGKYTDVILHRLISGFVLQGGGFQWSDNQTSPSTIESFSPVQNEFSSERSNTRGTIAMAKIGNDPDSATNQWFFNLADNSDNLDNQNGGFTVFGKTKTETDLLFVDILASSPVANAGGVFSNLPYLSLTENTITPPETVRFKSIEIIDQRKEIEFELSIDNADQTPIKATLENGQALISSENIIEQSSMDWLTLRATEKLSGQHLEQLIPVFNSTNDNLTGYQQLLDNALILSNHLNTKEDEQIDSIGLSSQTDSIIDIDQNQNIDLQDGELMLRHAFGTFPGLSLQQNLNGIAEDANPSDLLNSLNQLTTPVET